MMATSRRRSDALDVPADDAVATQMLADYVAFERFALECRLRAEQQIDAIKAELQAELAQIAALQKPRFAALKSWWEAGGNALAGKRRSVDIAGAKIGVRLSTPSLKLPPKMKAADVVEWLRSFSYVKHIDKMIRIKRELDKQATIKVIRDAPDVAEFMADKGITVKQTDEFFIDTGLSEPEPEKAALVE